MPPRQRKRRGPNSNSKNGCITCKFRHTKCGEEKPECLQCTTTNRKCGGYEDLSQQKLRQRVAKMHAAPAVTSDSRLVLLPCTREERQNVHHFCTYTVHALSGFFASELWQYYLPQISQTDVAIRHAITAVGAAHRRSLASSQLMTSPNFEVQQYNQAIRSLLGKASMNKDQVLVVCALFICLEFLRLNMPQALNHIEAGVNILSGHGQQSRESHLPEAVYQELSGFFSRMNLELSFWGRRSLSYADQINEDDLERFGFCNIMDARMKLNVIMIQTMRFVQFLGEGLQPRFGGQNQEPFKTQYNLIFQYRDWWIRFRKLTERLARSQDYMPNLRSILVTQVHYQTLFIWAQSINSPDEMGNDKFNTDFELVISLSEQVNLNDPNSKDHQPAFVLESGIAPALYLVARKCRHPVLRRRAMAALGRCAGQEGGWNTKQLCAIAQRNMELEEAALVHLPMEHRIPEDRDRIYGTFVVGGLESPVEVIFRWRDAESNAPKDYVEFINW